MKSVEVLSTYIEQKDMTYTHVLVRAKYFKIEKYFLFMILSPGLCKGHSDIPFCFAIEISENEALLMTLQGVNLVDEWNKRRKKARIIDAESLTREAYE